jgi:uncharacterized membrane protein YjfL (UPF0719 family)
MTNEQLQRSVIVKHKRWADFWSSIAIVVTIALFIVIGLVMDEAGASLEDRLGAGVLLGTIIIVTCVWQAAGLAVARLEIALRAPHDKEF